MLIQLYFLQPTSTFKTQLFTALAFYSGHLHSERDYELSIAINIDKEQLSSNSSSVCNRYFILGIPKV